MLPKRFDPSIEKKWQEEWRKKDLYRFDINDPRPVYSIDTPPPFTSGSLHLGHVYNHVWIDIVARYKRMTGWNVLLPQGFDCHGLPTELAVERNLNIRKQDRESFLKACEKWTEDAIERMKSQFDMLAYSTDWSLSYRTMSDEYKRVVQKTLLEFYKKGLLYRGKHPVLWCWKCGTALAKAEVGYIEREGSLYYIEVDVEGGKKTTIATTRPEMMPACVAVFVHPDDERYKDIVGKKATMPIFGQSVPIIADESVDREFGTGVVYLCTFGDEQDIKWQKKYNLPVVDLITPDGKLSEVAGDFSGETIEEGRRRIVKRLEELGRIKKVEKIKHNVLSHTERSSCQTPIELLPMEQWFIRVRDLLDEVTNAARTMNWYPPYMFGRLQDWSASMDWDWVISRQRVFGTPLPFWVCEKCGKIIPADEGELPVDPRGTVKKCSCGGTALGASDVCDCWVDSSITPLVISRWGKDNSFFEKTYPVTLRPQGYEIIRTWTFYTILRNLILTGKPCFRDLMVNGMVAGPDGKKMSKSLGNIITPEEVLSKYPADALRQWAAMGSLGEDYPFSWEECEHSNKFLTKLWNVSRFVEFMVRDYVEGPKPHLRATDRWIFSRLQGLISLIRENFDRYVFTIPVQELRGFVWHELADYYIEMVKHRLYKPEIYGEESKYAAQYTLLHVLSVILRLLAPVTPHITEEIYTSLFHKKSVHLQEFPDPDESLRDPRAEELGKILIDIISRIRVYKTDRGMPLNAEIGKILIEAPDPKAVEEIEEDIRGTGHISKISVQKGPNLKVSFP